MILVLLVLRSGAHGGWLVPLPMMNLKKRRPKAVFATEVCFYWGDSDFRNVQSDCLLGDLDMLGRW